jgi:hypothetical protein
MRIHNLPTRLPLIALVGAVTIVVINWPNWCSGKAVLHWHSASEIQVAGYYLYREDETSGDLTRINPVMIEVGPDPITGGKYSFTDTGLQPGATVSYQLEVLDRFGGTERYMLNGVEVKWNTGIEMAWVIFLLAFGVAGVLTRIGQLVAGRKILLFLCLVCLLVTPWLLPPARAAVVLSYFVGIPAQNSVTLEWETVTEIDVQGFYVQRSLDEVDNYQRINTQMIVAAGDPLLGRAYDYLDQTVINGTRYYYRLEVVDETDASTFFGPLEAIPGVSTLTPTASPTRTVTQAAQRTPTRTSTPVPPTRVITSTFTPTPTETYTITPIPEPTDTPTPDLFDLPTITTAFEETMTATLEITPSATAELFLPTTEPESWEGGHFSVRDLGRVGLLVLVAGLWILLGVWLYYYVSRLQQ